MGNEMIENETPKPEQTEDYKRAFNAHPAGQALPDRKRL